MKEVWKNKVCSSVKNCSYCPIFKPAHICLSIKLNDKLGDALKCEQFKELPDEWKIKIERRLEEEVKG